MTMRTPLKEVRRLGSAKEGADHFWMQRMTGAANLLLAIFAIGLTSCLVGADHATVVATLKQPLVAANRLDQFDVMATVTGGGLSGQAGAVRHGISKALTYYEPELRPVLKKGGFLTRDSRVVERKKYGRVKARRSFQFSKR